MDLVVEGKAYVNGGLQQCCIGVDGGKIVEIKKILKGDEHLNFENKLIFPAGIDMHVHFRDPGMTHKEDFSTGSLAAAFGGISCVFDMPNTSPQTTTASAIDDKTLTASKKSYIDFGIYAGVTNNNINFVGDISKKCSGFKIYLGSTTNALLLDKSNLRQTLQKISENKKPVLFHAEDDELLSKNKGIEKNLVDHLHFRPSICEEASIRNILQASQGLNLKVHICHLSSIEGLEILKNRPNSISCGVTPHHTLLSIENTQAQTFYKVNPPIRTNFDKEALFEAAKNGIVDVLESDHAPHTKDEKDCDFDKAMSGIPGVETMFPLYLYLAKKELISFQRVISLICENPARIMGVAKGKLDIGRDADFVVVDIKKESKIKSDVLHSKCGWTPFEKFPAIFPTHVFVRGEKLIEDGEMQVSQGFGSFVGE